MTSPMPNMAAQQSAQLQAQQSATPNYNPIPGQRPTPWAPRNMSIGPANGYGGSQFGGGGFDATNPVQPMGGYGGQQQGFGGGFGGQGMQSPYMPPQQMGGFPGMQGMGGGFGQFGGGMGGGFNPFGMGGGFGSPMGGMGGMGGFPGMGGMGGGMGGFGSPMGGMGGFPGMGGGFGFPMGGMGGFPGMGGQPMFGGLGGLGGLPQGGMQGGMQGWGQDAQRMAPERQMAMQPPQQGGGIPPGMSAMPGMPGSYYDPNNAAMVIQGPTRPQGGFDPFLNVTATATGQTTVPHQGPRQSPMGWQDRFNQLMGQNLTAPPPGWNPPQTSQNVASVIRGLPGLRAQTI